MRAGLSLMAMTAGIAGALAAKPVNLIPTVFSSDHRKNWTRRIRANPGHHPHQGLRERQRRRRQAISIMAKRGKIPWEQGRTAAFEKARAR